MDVISTIPHIGLTFPTGVVNPVLSSLFLRHLIRCGKSDTKCKSLLLSTGCSVLHTTFFEEALTLANCHIFLFHAAPSHQIWSTNKPAFSDNIMASVIILKSRFPFMLPLVAKTPIIWLHLPVKGTNMITMP